MTLLQYLLLTLSTAAAGLVQSVTGFGSGVVMMLFLPTVLPVLNASAVSSAISGACNTANGWLYRRSIRWDLLILPCIAYCVSSTVILQFAAGLDAGLIMKLFGGFLIILSLWFFFMADRIRIKPTPAAACLCALISGVTSALFGIGGPPMVLYYLPALQKKEEYLGTIQVFFLLTGLYTLIIRIIKGIYTAQLIPVTLLGMAGILAGVWVGHRIVGRINAELLRKIVYAFLAVSGVINLFS